jgi:molecular chaperone GrpE
MSKDKKHHKETPQKDIEEMESQAKEYLEGWQRAKADYANLKRRVDEDLQRVAKFANEDLILKVIPVLDNFKRAFKHIPQEHKESDWVKGIKQVERQLEEMLKQEGLEKMELLGEEFDPEEAEAMGFDIKSEYKDGEICEVLEDGYKLKDKVIRAAKVKICKK